MYAKNSTNRFAIGPVVAIADGAVQTSGVSVRLLQQGESAAAGGGTVAYQDGIVTYTPAAGEMNYDAVVAIAYKADCIPASVTVVTTTHVAQTGDSYAIVASETHGNAALKAIMDTSGVTLAADGLDAITNTEPTGLPTNFREKLLWLYRRFFKKATRTSDTITHYADDGTTSLLEQTISDSGGTETQGAASEPE